MNNSKLKIALAHDSFTQLGGAERVVDALHELFPDAPVYTLVLDSKLKNKYNNLDVRTSWLQIVYNFIPKLQYLLPLIPLAVSSLDFSNYDIVISSSSSFIKNIRVPKNAKHINYCHTPTRFLWSEPEYVDQEAPKFIRPLVKIMLNCMRNWDYKGAQRVTKFIANSNEVKNRILQYYNRESEVVYPFVDSDFWHPSKAKSNNFLLVGRLQPHKNNEFVINCFNELQLPLTVVGVGRQEKYLKSIAKKNIIFLGKISDTELRDEYSKSLAVIFPQVEDFGIVPLEASLCGTPTLAFAKGGALETIIAGVTGDFFDTYDVKNFVNMVLNFNKNMYREEILINQGKKFTKIAFTEKILRIVNT